MITAPPKHSLEQRKERLLRYIRSGMTSAGAYRRIVQEGYGIRKQEALRYIRESGKLKKVEPETREYLQKYRPGWNRNITLIQSFVEDSRHKPAIYKYLRNPENKILTERPIVREMQTIRGQSKTPEFKALIDSGRRHYFQLGILADFKNAKTGRVVRNVKAYGEMIPRIDRNKLGEYIAGAITSCIGKILEKYGKPGEEGDYHDLEDNPWVLVTLRRIYLLQRVIE